MEANTTLEIAGVEHCDLALRNLIHDTQNLGNRGFQIKVIDFNVATVHRFRGGKMTDTTRSLPTSPVDRYWNGSPVYMEDWNDDYCFGMRSWRR